MRNSSHLEVPSTKFDDSSQRNSRNPTKKVFERRPFWVVLGAPSNSILSRDPNLFRKPSKTQGKQI